MKSRLFQIWFSLRCGVAGHEFIPLLEQYGSPYEIFTAGETEIERMPCSDRLKKALCDKDLDESNRILTYCDTNGVHLLFWQDEAYPASLRTMQDPPMLLYYLGEWPDMDHRLCISVVGTRKMSEYGKRMAYKIGYELAAAGTVVVSGMALGVDGVAAAGALAANGCTVAVLGCGIDRVYPAEHTTLAKAIRRKGAVVTEFPPATPPVGRNFPVRNRIISGLSRGTVVVEANKGSGALITAKTAILQGRDIYAVPGNVGEENTSGTNQLIHDGATVVLRARDVLDNYTFLYRDTINTAKLLKAEERSEPQDEVFARLRVHTRTVGRTVDPSAANRPGSAFAPDAPKVGNMPSPSVPPATRDRRTSCDADVPSQPAPRRNRAESASPAPAVPPKAVPRSGDRSEEILKSLTDTQRGIFEALPLDRAVPVDYLTREGFSMSDIMAAMTILEIKGLTVCLPGGLFSRK